MPRTYYEQILNTFGKVLRKARVRAKYTSAEQFAKKLGIEPHTYRKYERGETHPNPVILTRICMDLTITPNDLFPEAAGARPLSAGGVRKLIANAQAFPKKRT